MTKLVLKIVDRALGVIWALCVLSAVISFVSFGVTLIVFPSDVTLLIRMAAASIGFTIIALVTLVIWWLANKLDIWP